MLPLFRMVNELNGFTVEMCVISFALNTLVALSSPVVFCQFVRHICNHASRHKISVINLFKGVLAHVVCGALLTSFSEAELAVI